eukprot:1158747-Pelagomonas_calceolata.AAC.22
MMIPDYALVAEVMLFSEGFEDSKTLSRKMVNLYKLSSEQLSQQVGLCCGRKRNTYKIALLFPCEEDKLHPLARQENFLGFMRLFRAYQKAVSSQACTAVQGCLLWVWNNCAEAIFYLHVVHTGLCSKGT